MPRLAGGQDRLPRWTLIPSPLKRPKPTSLVTTLPISLQLGKGVVTDIAGQGDLVLANIIAKVIIGIAPELYHRVKPGGMLLASGIIADKEAAVVAALVDVGFTIIQRTTKEEWVCLAVRRP